MPIRHVVDVEDAVQREEGSIEKEEHEWLDVDIADAVVSPWTMMIHLIHAFVALAAVVDAVDLEGTASPALYADGIYILGVNCLMFFGAFIGLVCPFVLVLDVL